MATNDEILSDMAVKERAETEDVRQIRVDGLDEEAALDVLEHNLDLPEGTINIATYQGLQPVFWAIKTRPARLN
jgi:hypothetical protein